MGPIIAQTLPLTRLERNKGQLQGLPKNPRVIRDDKFDKLKQSIQDDPEMLSLRELLVYPLPDSDHFIVIGGNMRLAALKELKETEAPCKILPADTPEDKLKRIAIKDNNGYGEWDYDLLANEWSEELLIACALDIPTVDIMPEEEEATEDDFNEEEDEVQPITQPGDIWQLGRHRLLCGDSTNPADIAQLMAGGGADLFLTDPPYNVDYEGSDGKKIKNDKMGDGAFHQFLTDAFTAANTALKPGCAIYIWHADSEGYNFRSAFKAAGWTLRQCLIWVKNSLVLGRQDYQWKHEPCLYGWKDGAAHYFTNSRTETTTIEDQGLEFEKMKKDELVKLLKEIYSDKVETTIIHENKPARNAEHPTMKPIRLLARLIRNSSRQSQVVLDTFGGSGSTLIACEQMNRTCYTMELDPHYCDVIIARWEKLTGQTATKITNIKQQDHD